MEISTALASKANRLVDQDRVTHVKGLMYQVQGDSGTEWNVHLSYPEEVTGACNCPSTAAVCSHIFAASIVHLSKDGIDLAVSIPSTDPFEGLN